jgi:putative heme-binding domain-containing protein
LAGPAGRNDPAVRAFLTAAAERAAAAGAPTAERVSATALLAYAEFDNVSAGLAALLDARQPVEVQLQAVRTLDRLGDARGAALLTAPERWSRYTPQVREAAIAALTARPAAIAALFAAIRAGTVAPAEISSTRRTQLMKHADAEVKKAAAEIFQKLEGGDRMEVYRKLRERLDPRADVAKGREVFVRACSACHTHRGAGGLVGPDLTGVRNQPADALLLHIVVPNYEVYPAYQSVTVATRDGRTIAGWLAAESSGSLTLRTAAGTEETVLRSEVASLTASGLSLMPDGLEQTMADGEMAALIAFLKSDA